MATVSGMPITYAFNGASPNRRQSDFHLIGGSGSICAGRVPRHRADAVVRSSEFAQMDDCDEQTDQTANVARIVDVSDPDESRQVHNPAPRGEVLPCRVVGAVQGTQPVTSNSGGEREAKDDQESAKVVTKCSSTGECWDSDPSDEPSRKEPDPPGCEEADLAD